MKKPILWQKKPAKLRSNQDQLRLSKFPEIIDGHPADILLSQWGSLLRWSVAIRYEMCSDSTRFQGISAELRR